jgi:hypothetical protein
MQYFELYLVFGFRARLPGKAAGEGCMARVQYAESMVKLVENAVF